MIVFNKKIQLYKHYRIINRNKKGNTVIYNNMYETVEIGRASCRERE